MASAPSNQSATVKTFGDALRLQARVIYALILRETRTAYGHTKIGYVWALIEPAMYIGVFIIIFTAIGRSSPLPGDTPYFFLTGLIPYLMFRKIVGKIMTCEDANQSLLTYPQVTLFDVKLARVILEVSIHFIVVLLLLIGLPLIGFNHNPIHSPMMMIVVIFFVAAFSLSVGNINCLIMKFWPSYEKIYGLTLNRPVFFLSGIFYLPEQIPLPYREWLMYNPMARFIAWFRESTYVSFESDFSYTTNFIIAMTAVFFLGLYINKIKV